MIFRDFLEKSIGSYAKVKILKYILADGGISSENEIARLLDLSPMTVNRVMKVFMELNLVTQSRAGGANIWKLNKESWSYSILKPIKDIRANPLEELKSMLKGFVIFTFIKEFYLFGSVSEGKEDYTSDIDLLFVVGNKKDKMNKKLNKYIEKFNENCFKRFGNRLSVYFLLENEKKSKLFENAKRGIKLK